MDEKEILRELSAVMDELSALPVDAFSERFPLVERRDELRRLLAEAQVEAGRDASEAWANQAARKGPDDAETFIEAHLPEAGASGLG